MVKLPKVSIIIPLWIISDRFFEDLKKFDKLNYKNAEILVVSDRKVDLPKLKKFELKLILTGKKKTGPAEKRDIAIKRAKGSICAFIDDDAYPDKNWLTTAVKWFSNVNVVAIGGPGITPSEDLYMEKIGGSIIESFLCSGGVQYRYLPTSKAFVEDYPAYNLFVRKKVLQKVGGYNCNFYGGEDTFLCMKLIKHGDIIYDPEVVVYHHRRAFPIKHLIQISNVGMHRGYFFKKFPKTSRKFFYLLPTFLTMGLVVFISMTLIYSEVLLLPLSFVFVLFWMLGSLSIYKRGKKLLQALIGGLGIIMTHIVYGTSFLKGITTPKMTR